MASTRTGLRANGAVGDGAIDTHDVLIDHAPGPDVEVSDFAVAHLALGKAHPRSRGLDERARITRPQRIHVGRAGQPHRVVLGFLPPAPPVHDEQENLAAFRRHGAFLAFASFSRLVRAVSLPGSSRNASRNCASASSKRRCMAYTDPECRAAVGIAGLGLDRGLRQAPGIFHAARVHEHDRQVVHGVEVVGLESDALLQGVLGFGIHLEIPVAHREVVVRGVEAGSHADRFPVGVDRLLEFAALLITLPEVVLRIRVVGCQVTQRLELLHGFRGGVGIRHGGCAFALAVQRGDRLGAERGRDIGVKRVRERLARHVAGTRQPREREHRGRHVQDRRPCRARGPS